MKTYCTQNSGNCISCSLSNYGRDCMNEPIVIMNREEIITHVGADDWEMVVNEYQDETFIDILDDLNGMFPHDDNDDLAMSIWYEFEKV